MFLVNLRKFVKYFAGEKKKDIVIYLIMSYFASILEVFGVAIIYPFILLILKPEIAAKLPFQISPVLLGMLVLGLFVVKNIYMVYCVKRQGSLVKGIETDIMKYFISFFLDAPFSVTSRISRTQKERVVSILPLESVNNFFVRFLNLNINIAIVLSILLLLLVKFPLPTIVTAVLAVLTICVQNKYSKSILKMTSDTLWNSQKSYDLIKGAIMPNLKLIKLAGHENVFKKQVESALEPLKISQADYFTATTAQPYILEPLVIILLFVMLGTIAVTTCGDKNVMIASFAIAASAIFRILPALARVQTSLNGIVLGRKYAKELIDFYENYCLNNSSPLERLPVKAFNQSIALNHITFAYPDHPPVIDNLNLNINKNEFVGIIGESGAGKTTLIDIISGLLSPSSGEVLIDNVKLEQGQSIKSMIGYVPQEPVFFNTTFRENVAFGNSDIDDKRVIEVLKQAAIYDFIEKNYEEGIYALPMVDTVGLSLGQKQRLSIARALYNNPQILILDEATSALDLETEKEICTLLANLKNGMTIIAVAHRLSTLAACDRLFLLKNGTVCAEGTFKDLESTSSEFQKLLAIQKLNNTLF